MKKGFLSVFSFFCVLVGFSQEIPTKENEVDEIIDMLLEEEVFNDLVMSFSSYDFLYLSVNYNSDTYFSGRAIDIDQFNITPQITYMNSNGFYVSVSGIIYSEFRPNWDVTIGTIGYGNNFGKHDLFKYSASMSGYLYSDNEVDGLYNGTANAGIGVRNKNRTIGTQLYFSYYFGGEATYQIVSRTYANIHLLKRKKHQLKLSPQLSFITGTQLVDIRNPLQKQLDVKVNATNEVNLTSNKYTLIYTQINLPLQYSVNSFDFEIGFNVNLPSAMENETDVKSTNFFNASVSYLIDL